MFVPLNVLVACEFSGIVRDAFIKRGHYAMSCDLLPSDTPGPHLQRDIGMVNLSGVDLLIAHPPCTYLSSSGLHWNKRVPGRQELTEKALEFVRFLMLAPVAKIAIENPIGCISSRICKPTQIIKKERYANQTASGQNKLGPSADRWKLRSVTYQGIADAMADQWGTQ